MKKENKKYVEFMLEYIENNSCYSTRRLSHVYLKEHPDFHKGARIKLNRIFGGYIASATFEGCTEFLEKTRRYSRYVSNHKIIKFFKGLLKGEKCENRCHLMMLVEKTDRNIKWRTFKEMEQLEIHNGYAKMYFLGSLSDNSGTEHFKKLWNEVENGI